MSYDVVVWVGEMPRSDRAALARYVELMSEMEEQLEAETPPPPAPALLQYAAELLDHYPDIGSDAGADSPWAGGPLQSDIVGSVFAFTMTFSRAPAALPFVAERAQAHDLVCFDPQTEKLLTTARSRRRWRRHG